MSDPISIDAFEQQYVRPKPGRVLIIGSHIYKNRVDRRARYKGDCIGVDMIEGPGVDRVVDFTQDLPADLGQFAHIECNSVLEHCMNPWRMASNIERTLEPSGTVFVSAPFVWRVHAYPADYWRFTSAGFKLLFQGVHWRVLSYVNGHIKKTGPRSLMYGGESYLARTLTCGFGVKL